MKQYTFKDGIKVIASTKEEAIKKHKATAVFRYNELIRLNRCLELLEKQTDICGKRLYFSVDVDTETVKVFLTPEKKDVYLTVNVGGDSTAAAMYDIWDAIYSKI